MKADEDNNNVKTVVRDAISTFSSIQRSRASQASRSGGNSGANSSSLSAGFGSTGRMSLQNSVITEGEDEDAFSERNEGTGPNSNSMMPLPSKLLANNPADLALSNQVIAGKEATSLRDLTLQTFTTSELEEMGTSILDDSEHGDESVSTKDGLAPFEDIPSKSLGDEDDSDEDFSEDSVVYAVPYPTASTKGLETPHKRGRNSWGDVNVSTFVNDGDTEKQESPQKADASEVASSPAPTQPSSPAKLASSNLPNNLPPHLSYVASRVQEVRVIQEKAAAKRSGY